MVFAGTGVWKSKRGTPLLGRRCVFINDEHYGYNVRDELISADEVSYAYDDIGNRTTAEGKTYTANNLNQYTAIDDFAPQYDDDGNQSLIKTETGIWSVVYNAENRPIRWESGDTVITMAFDRMGSRIEMRTVKDGAETLQRFVYDNYLCIQQLRGADNALFHSYVWDPTEPIATRPLVFLPASGEIAYYFHDGNKNVSDLVALSGAFVHYDYTPFGTSTASASSENPFRFSSEFHDDTLDLVYYNYRHYNLKDGRWLSRDPLGERITISLMGFNGNAPIAKCDSLGLATGRLDHKNCTYTLTFRVVIIVRAENLAKDKEKYDRLSPIYKKRVEAVFNGNNFKIKPTIKSKKLSECCPEGVKPLLNIEPVFTVSRGDKYDFILDVSNTPKGDQRAGTDVRENIIPRMFVWDSDFSSNRPTFAHEFGHALGLNHPGHGIVDPTTNKPIVPNSPEEYAYTGKDIHNRDVAKDDLMGVGSNLREFYFEQWERELSNECL